MRRRLWPLVVAVMAAAPLLADPAVGQTAIDVGPRAMRFGRPVRATTHEVRLGENHGNAYGFAVRMERGWQRATAWLSITDAVSWPVGTADGPNPGPGARYDDLELWALTLGAGHRFPAGIGGTAGGGLLAMTCRFRNCGSGPLFAPILEADVDACIGTTATLRVCARAGAGAVVPYRGRWTWLADRAYEGRADDPDEVHGDVWFPIGHAGLTVGLRF